MAKRPKTNINKMRKAQKYNKNQNYNFFRTIEVNTSNT